ncbi:hypothetical protein ABN584_25505 [Gloeocapsa sp. BRSZ]
MTLLHQNILPVSLPTCDGRKANRLRHRCFFRWKDLTNSASDRAFSRTVPVY